MPRFAGQGRVLRQVGHHAMQSHVTAGIEARRIGNCLADLSQGRVVHPVGSIVVARGEISGFIPPQVGPKKLGQGGIA